MNNTLIQLNGINNRIPLSSLTNKQSISINNDLKIANIKQQKLGLNQHLLQLNNYDTVYEDASSDILPLINNNSNKNTSGTNSQTTITTNNENCLSSASQVTNQSLNDTLTHTIISNYSSNADSTENTNSTSSNLAKQTQKLKKR
jgi:hypothetical protein